MNKGSAQFPTKSFRNQIRYGMRQWTITFCNGDVQEKTPGTRQEMESRLRDDPKYKNDPRFKVTPIK